MERICSTLSHAGFAVTLVGRMRRSSLPLAKKGYIQKRLRCIFNKGFLFYAEYNTRLFFFLLYNKTDAVCAIDLDTILPVYYSSRVRGCARILDSHEYFTQQKEVLTRPFVYRIWHYIEKKYLPLFPNGYTVSNSIAAAFKKAYEINHIVVRNVPRFKELPVTNTRTGSPVIIYQGAVNEARGLESLIPSMKQVNAILEIYGDGNFMERAKELVRTNNLEDKVFMKGMLSPRLLEDITPGATIGVNLVEPSGLNQLYSLANKFFDFLMNEVPQVTMDFPEYRAVNQNFEVALLIPDITTRSVTGALQQLLENQDLYNRLKENCRVARKIYNWQEEEKILLSFYNNIFG